MDFDLNKGFNRRAKQAEFFLALLPLELHGSANFDEISAQILFSFFAYKSPNFVIISLKNCDQMNFWSRIKKFLITELLKFRRTGAGVPKKSKRSGPVRVKVSSVRPACS